MSSIPGEIQDAIVDHLHTDVPTLSQCSLVSKQWLIRARHWSYAHRQAKLIAQSDIPPIPEALHEKQDAHRFVELLHAPHSTLAPYVQCLLLIGPDLGHEASDVEGPQSDYDVLNALIVNHMSLLRNLRAITIAAITWRCLRPEAKTVIASLQHVTSVSWESVAFDRLTSSIEFCAAHFSGLKKLKIRQMMVTEHETQNVTVLTERGIFPQLHLLDLVVDNTTRTLLTVSPSAYIQPQNIDTLCFGNVSINDAAIVGCFLEASGPALRHVALDIARNLVPSDYRAIPISFSRNSNLRSLELSTFHLNDPSEPCDDISWLQALVVTITSLNFERITLWFTGGSRRGAWVENFDFRSFEYSLMHRTDPPTLPIVHITFVQTRAWDDVDNDWLVAAVERQLPALHQHGILVVDPNDPTPTEGFDGWWPFVW